MRTVQLGTDRIHLLGKVPGRGERLTAEFSIPAARLADTPLTADELRRGLIVVSTLPNIQKHACMVQIVDLEERVRQEFPGTRIVHVSADHTEHWREVDQFHPDIRAAGYSLCCADLADRKAFTGAFGVGVKDHHRIAHGLFALTDGVFLAVSIPDDQLRTPEIDAFLEMVRADGWGPTSGSPASETGR